ncbi:UDP-2,3-diacylglucosamine diphosphatase [Larsenimonas salina]|uniref:UDP-2,3-diacylglucosamine diphosphatase n=1 Tax=Larsenimonas salina TaxID=1295565 RepID=UPI002073F3BB|nr:UDP-2,3-diacylglucosamine diphosphatase [Larsenimonas salina]MCM5703778.1 UDP-2,3-diacylglucosamine diphosphatase [Larsenimonas salina]
MTTTLFISDIHLFEQEPETAQGFLDYLAFRAPDADDLYILGDLFEGWIGDDAQGPFEARIIEALRTLSEQGTRVHVMHGNRDFLLGHAFAEESHTHLIDDPSLIALGDTPVLLMHGDSLCTQDPEYMKFRAMARDPNWQNAILAKPLEERLALAKQLRQQSGEANSRKADDIMDVAPDAVLDALREHNVRTLIHGHTHRPDIHDVDLGGDAAKRYVLGDWKDNLGWELRHEGDTLSLVSFSLTDLSHA